MTKQPKKAKVLRVETPAVQPKEELAIVPQTQSADALISQAIKKGLPVETMERLLAMRKELKAEWAKEQFDIAMAKAQSEFPEIIKNKSVKNNQEKELYRYATLGNIVKQVKTPISENGLSYVIKTEEYEKGEKQWVRAITIVKHFNGHSEETPFSVPLGTKTDIMSASQWVSAAYTFAKRNSFCNAFGIITADEDNEKALKEEEGQRNAGELSGKIAKCKTEEDLIALYNLQSKEDKASVEVLEMFKNAKSKLTTKNDNPQNAPAQSRMV